MVDLNPITNETLQLKGRVVRLSKGAWGRTSPSCMLSMKQNTLKKKTHVSKKPKNGK